ncbi:MAG: hypothetical protein AAB037_01580 [Chloroflexota bacterium]
MITQRFLKLFVIPLTIAGEVCAQPGIDLKISSPANKYFVNSPIPILVTIRNQTGNKLWVPKRLHSQYFLRFTVLDEKGKAMSYFGPELEIRTIKADFVLLPANGRFEAEIDLTYLHPDELPFSHSGGLERRFDLGPGNYIVKAQYLAGLLHYKQAGISIGWYDYIIGRQRFWMETVESNELHISLIPGYDNKEKQKQLRSH